MRPTTQLAKSRYRERTIGRTSQGRTLIMRGSRGFGRMGEVLHLFTCLVHRFPMREVSKIEVIQDKGLKGCIHGRPGSKRQVSLMDRETLGKFGLAPGVVKENITTQGMDFQSLATGNVLRI